MTPELQMSDLLFKRRVSKDRNRIVHFLRPLLRKSSLSWIVVVAALAIVVPGVVRAEALLVDVRGSLEALQGQKALVDLAIEKAGSLRFLLKQAEATIDGFREERKMTADVRAARELVAQGDEDDEEVARTAA